MFMSHDRYIFSVSYKVTYTNAVKNYTKYLKHMSELSKEFNMDSGKLEMFIFELGLNLKVR